MANIQGHLYILHEKLFTLQNERKHLSELQDFDSEESARVHHVIMQHVQRELTTVQELLSSYVDQLRK